jgi:membrane protease YdiL (CAAX protease family)
VSRNYRLHERPALAVTLLLILYIVTAVASDSFAQAVFPGAPRLATLGKLAWFAVLTFVVIPKALGLPSGDRAIGPFLTDTGLRTIRPFGRLLLLTLTCYAIFVVSQLAGAQVYHATRESTFVLDLSRHGLFASQSVIAGIFEEIVMRGVIVTLLLRNTTKRKAILVSAAVFAGIHLLNMLNPRADHVWVLGQATWAFALGVMYAQLFIAFRSLYPPICVHYLINALVNVWFRGPDATSAESVGYGIVFFGVVPAVLAYLWTRFLARRRI